MRFKFDENLPHELVDLFREADHNASSVIEQNLSGSSDTRIIDICRFEERVLVTLDLDFSDVRAYPTRDHFGIIVKRLWRQDKRSILDILERTLPLLRQEQLTHRLWIVEETRVRIRGDET